MIRIRFYYMERSGVLSRHTGGHLHLGDDEELTSALARRLARDTSRPVLQMERHSVVQSPGNTILKMNAAVGELTHNGARIDGACIISVHLPN